MKRKMSMREAAKGNRVGEYDCYWCEEASMIDLERPVQLDANGDLTVECPDCGAHYLYHLQQRFSYKMDDER